MGKCNYDGCTIQPNYNYEGVKQPLYCGKHKLDVMINVMAKFCIFPGCKVLPVFNNEGTKKPLYCGKHKLDGMVNVINKTCIHEGCNVQPNYNVEGETKPLYCGKHKLDGMVNVKIKPCIHEGCKIIPGFNIEGSKKPLYCATHKLDGMIDVRNKKCKSSWCFTAVTDKYDGYCQYCYMNLFPDKPITRNYKTKEYAVVEFVKNTFSDLSWIADKHISGGCSKRRPDLFLDMGFQIIIIEIDENQHLNYDCSCENKRIMELSQDVGHRPIIFIRFNPDEYILNKTTITSCWGQTKQGICVVKKSKKNEWNDRLNDLKDQIKYWIHPDNAINKTVETIQMFYDE